MNVIKAIDVGYGNVKYTSLLVGNEIQCGLFPALAPQATHGPDLALGLLQKPNTAVVEVEGIFYVVGKDARLSQDATHGRILDPDYSMTDTHMALIRGALFFMGEHEIDMLVLGLPVNTHAKYHEALAKRVIGVHPVPFKNGKKECLVKNVRVLPQPIGAFFDYTSQCGTYDKMRAQMNLLVDVGYYTLDWVVATGTKVNSARTGATNGGMSAVLRAIADSVGRELNEMITDTSSIETALINGVNPIFYGDEFEIADHLRHGRAKADAFINTLATKVGESYDIANIIMTGGGASFFKESLQAKFPRHKIITTGDPIYANVRGFYRAGTQYMNAVRAA